MCRMVGGRKKHIMKHIPDFCLCFCFCGRGLLTGNLSTSYPSQPASSTQPTLRFFALLSSSCVLELLELNFSQGNGVLVE